MNSENKICQTILLDDSPASEDAFASNGDVGPHRRVADAIAEMIESAEIGGKAIGLEGGWGSGKSTVVRMLKERFDTDNDHTVVIFDAWAHEGDPLRRTFLETVVHALQSIPWISPTDWHAHLQVLAKRKKTTTTKITPKPTRLGKAMAVSLLLVPIGSSFLAAGLRSGVTIDRSLPANWNFLSGMFLMFAPFLVLIFNGIRISWGRWRNKLGTQEGNDGSEWALLLSRAINETETETIETPNPTSLEFEEYFKRLIQESLADNPNRRLLLVLDNLDRVETETALSIWGTLQTFLRVRDYESEAWFQKLWVIVPYDPLRITKLWAETAQAEIDEDKNPKHTTVTNSTESFLDKSFQVRFHVSPPVLSDWQNFLYQLIQEALPNHEDDKHIIYRVFDHCRTRNGNPPTPRELKLYVNQIGAVHRQWQHEFPMGHIAFFALVRKGNPHFLEQLREGAIPAESDLQLLGDGLTQSMAGLAFNVKADKGMELLLGGIIQEALKDSTAERILSVASNHEDGFWTVLEAVAQLHWEEISASDVCSISQCLHASDLIVQHDGPEKATILRRLGKAADVVKDWGPFDEHVAKGVCDLISLQNSKSFSSRVAKKLISQLQKAKSSENVSPQEGMSHLLLVLERISELGHSESIPKQITVPYTSDDWVVAAETLAKQDADQQFWDRIRPTGEFSEIKSTLAQAITGGTLSESHLGMIRVTEVSPLKTDWKDTVLEVRNRLEASQSPTTEQLIYLQRMMLVFENLRVDESTSAIKYLVEGGHLAHHFHKAHSDGEESAMAVLMFNLLRFNSQLTEPGENGNSIPGHNRFKKHVESESSGVMEHFYQVLEEFGRLPALFNIADEMKQYCPCITDLLRKRADSEEPQAVFTNDTILKRWRDLRPLLNTDDKSNRFQNLTSYLAKGHGLYEAIWNHDGGFSASSALFYLDVYRGDKSNDGFSKWCQQGLSSLNESDWLADLSGGQACCAIAIELPDNWKPTLTTGFRDALLQHAQMILNGKHLPPEWMRPKWDTLLDCFQQAIRTTFCERLVEAVVDVDGDIDDSFFTMYGNEILCPDILVKSQTVVSHFFSPLVKKKHSEGMKWLDRLLSDNPTLFESEVPEHHIEEFRTRLQEYVDSPEDDENQILIEAIASKLGIEAAIEQDNGGDDDENESENPTESDSADHNQN